MLHVSEGCVFVIVRPLRVCRVDQVRLRGEDEELDRAERLIREFQAENWTMETPVALDDEVQQCALYELQTDLFFVAPEPYVGRNVMRHFLVSAPPRITS